MKVVRLSALRTGRHYPPGNIPGTHFCLGLSQSQGHSVAGRIMSMTSSGIEPVTFWLVAQCLTQLGHRVSPYRGDVLTILHDVNKYEQFGDN